MGPYDWFYAIQTELDKKKLSEKQPEENLDEVLLDIYKKVYSKAKSLSFKEIEALRGKFEDIF